ncbi:MAG: hypothetical protein ACFFDF_09070 [Candidatus Odinarchaeota archaeon]
MIEKSLLLGFGIFTITIFSSIIIPFLGTIIEFNQNDRDELETYISFINEIDEGINYIIQNQDKIYLKTIESPSNFNISFYTNIAKYEFYFEHQFCVKIKEYNETFSNRDFHLILPSIYLLNISFYSSLIIVNIRNLN